MEGAATKAMLDASGRSGNAADGPERLSAAAVALRPAAENFQQDRGPCPGNLSAAVREANACGRKLDTTPASIFSSLLITTHQITPFRTTDLDLLLTGSRSS